MDDMNPGNGSGGSGFGGNLPGRARGRLPGRRSRWMAGLGVAALLVGGGAVLGSALAGNGHGAKPAGTMLISNASAAGTSAAGQTDAALAASLGMPASLGAGQAGAAGAPAGPVPSAVRADVRRCVAAARQLRAAGQTAAARAALRSCAGRFLHRFGHLRWFLRQRLRLLLGAEHGQLTVTTKNGTKTFAFERGMIQTANGTSVVVRAADGTTWTWDLVSKTVVVRAGQRTTTSALATGEQVFVAGPVVSGADDARLIVIRR